MKTQKQPLLEKIADFADILHSLINKIIAIAMLSAFIFLLLKCS